MDLTLSCFWISGSLKNLIIPESSVSHPGSSSVSLENPLKKGVYQCFLLLVGLV